MKRWLKGIGWSLGCLLGAACARNTSVVHEAHDPAAVRVLALGDSITQGRGRQSLKVPATQSWRYPFWRTLLMQGVRVDMVGAFEHGFEGDPDWPAVNGVPFDRDHESRWGYRLDEVIDLLRKDIDHLQFDVAMVLLGGNDLDQREAMADLWPEWEALLALLRAHNPAVKVAVGVYCHDFGGAAEYRAALTEHVAGWSTPESPVVIANGCGKWVADPGQPGADTVDWIHPNAQGDAKIASGFVASLRALRPDAFPAQGEAAPPSTSAPVTLTR